jgi:predicted kinase
MNRELIDTCGLAFSGKPTVARRVAAALDPELVSYDAIYARRGFGGGEVIADAEWKKTSLMAEGSSCCCPHAACRHRDAGAPVERGRSRTVARREKRG